MTTLTEHYSTTSSNPSQAGCLAQGIAIISGAYLIGMIAYLALRLIFGSEIWWLALLNAFAIYTFMPVLLLIPLALLAGLWRMVVRLGFIALLAIVWFGPFFQPNNPSARGAPTITVATLNLAVNGNGFSENIALFDAWLEDHQVDLVVFQETPDSYRENGIPELLDTFPHYVPQTEGREEGLRRMVMSRYPAVESSTGTAFQRIVLDVEGQQIAVYNVHFAWPFLEEPRLDVDTSSSWLNLMLRYDETVRNREIDDFLEIIEQETLPYIVAGDFNTSQHSIIYSSLALEMNDSFREASSGLGATWPVEVYGPLLPPMLRIDYIWYSDDFRAIAAEVGPDVGSDHLPYTATLEILTPVEEAE